MKKVVAILSVAVLTVSLAACGNSSQSASTSASASSASSSAAEEVVGGWTLNSDMKGKMPDEAQKAFDKAMESYDEEELEAINYMGSQVVSGTNHMILCKASNPAGLKMAVVYEDLQGNAEITKTTDFDIAAYAQDTSSNPGEQGLSGGWTVYEDQPDASLPSDVKKAFDTAMKGWTGAEYLPAVYLASQVVSGCNYAILCKQTLVTAEPVTNLAVVYIYAPASGDAEIMNIYALDLAAFNE